MQLKVNDVMSIIQGADIEGALQVRTKCRSARRDYPRSSGNQGEVA
jgi:hypothetical protein